MKHRIILLVISLLTTMAVPQGVKAYDFSAISPSGHRLYYKIVEGNAVVTYKEYVPDNHEGDTNMSGDIIIPATAGGYTVTGIGNRAFMNCTRITSVSFPNSITQIQGEAFGGCTGLTSVTIPENVTLLENAFPNCIHLTTVYYNATNCTEAWIPFTTEPGFGETNYSSSVTTVVIGSNVQVIPDDIFGGCVQLSSVNIPFSVTTIGAAFWGCSNLTNINIPSSVTTIGEQAFQLSGLTSVAIPNSVNSIGLQAFALCHNLTTVFYSADSCVYEYHRDGYSGYTGGMFEGCENLSTVHFGSNVRYIPPYMFYGCTGLSSVSIPDGVRKIQYNTFGNCTGLHSVHLGNSVTHIDTKAFIGCCNLTSINFPISLSRISSEAFLNCTGLTHITFPDKLNVINYRAFYGCSGLQSITFGKGNPISSFGYEAFFNCNNIAEIHSRALNPPLWDRDVFSTASDIPVYIPCGTRAAYSSGWNYFSNFVENAHTFVLTVESDNETMGYAEIVMYPSCQDYYAMVEATANDGYQFDHWQDGDQSNPRMVEMWNDTTLVAYFTVVSGIDPASSDNVLVRADRGQIHIQGATGLPVGIYDIVGHRVVGIAMPLDDEATFPVNQSGVYFVKVGSLPTRKVIVLNK